MGIGRLHREVRRYRDDLRWFSERCLMVKPKAPGPLIPLAFNRVQIYLHERLEAQKAKRGFVRAIVLKGRQTTISTYVCARFYHQTSLREGINSYILSYHQDSTDILFAMVQRFWENSPLRPQTDTSNAKELRFDRLNSGYAVGTAGSTATGRSGTIQLLQADECAFWKNAPAHFAGVVQAVPLQPGTEVILLSTANGMGNEFHARWQQAEAGIGDYDAIFIPFFWAEDYRLPVPEGFVPSEEEIQFLAAHADSRFPPTMETVVWRRQKLLELKDPALFKQEYPATPMEAFMFSGEDSFIAPAIVAAARKADLAGVGPLVIGADPTARSGRFSVAWRKGRRVLKVESRSGLDTLAGAGWLKDIIDRERPARLFVDLGDVGKAIYDILQSWGEPYATTVVGVNFGDPPLTPDRILDDGTVVPGAKNRRAEMWDASLSWLTQAGGAQIPDMDSLQADACGPQYSYDIRQRLQLESKEHMAARGIRSPDEWDAVALTFAEPVISAPPRPAPPPRRAQAGRLSWMGA